MNIKPLPFSSNDIPSLASLQPEGWPDILPFFKFYTNNDFCLPFKFTLEGLSVGLGVVIFHQSSAWLAHIIVHKEFRNRGIGSFITQTLLKAIDTALYPTVSLIATPMGEPVYSKFGFEKVLDYHFFQKEACPVLPAPEAISYTSQFKDQLLELDKKMSGEDRMALLEPHLAQTIVHVDNNKLLGFFMPSLNEGMIVASHEEAGIELMKIRLQNHSTAVIPENNSAALNFLSENGFKLVKTGVRMSLGKGIHFQPTLVYNRIGGHLG